MNFEGGENYGPLFGTRTLEQSFLPVGKTIRKVGVFLESPSWLATNHVLMEIVDQTTNRSHRPSDTISGVKGAMWHDFRLYSVPLPENTVCEIRLTAPTTSSVGGGVIWWSSAGDKYDGGQAIVDGTPQESNFSFRIDFVR